MVGVARRVLVLSVYIFKGGFGVAKAGQPLFCKHPKKPLQGPYANYPYRLFNRNPAATATIRATMPGRMKL
jgi:hypothetical protein